MLPPRGPACVRDPDHSHMGRVRQNTADLATGSAALCCCSKNFPEGLTLALESGRTHPWSLPLGGLLGPSSSFLPLRRTRREELAGGSNSHPAGSAEEEASLARSSWSYHLLGLGLLISWALESTTAPFWPLPTMKSASG